uniref:Unannotated protein n=1 Tax=freshwater metagenome TaxID=449393 RepID=A0A6J5ZSJ4_9ZZZZ
MPAKIEETTTDGHATVTLTSASGELEATYAPGTGMVCCSLRRRGEEMLGQRGGLAAYAEKGSTFGIPLLYPWANRLAAMSYSFEGTDVTLDAASSPLHFDAAGLPMHGVLAASPYWELTDTGADDNSAQLQARLDFSAHSELAAAFPFRHMLEMGVALDDETLTVTTTVIPTGDGRVPVAFGYHPYLALPGGSRSGVEIELPVVRHALLGADGLPTGETEAASGAKAPLAERSFDDLFDELSDPKQFRLAGPGSEISVEFDRGYNFAQVYAPADQPFICFEPMTSPTNSLVSGDRLATVAPGEQFQASFSIRAQSRGAGMIAR